METRKTLSSLLKTDSRYKKENLENYSEDRYFANGIPYKDAYLQFLVPMLQTTPGKKKAIL